MTPLTDVIEALAAQIDTITGLRVSDHVPESTEYPAAFIVPPVIEYEGLDDGELICDVQVVLLVSSTVGRNQKQLYPWLAGSGSIRAKLQDNRSLGLSDVDAHATSARPLGLQEMASYGAYGAVVNVQVMVGP